MGTQTYSERKKNSQSSRRFEQTQPQRTLFLSPEGPVPQEVQRAVLNPRSLTPSMVMYLQRTAGNQAVVQLLADVRRPNTAAQAAEAPSDAPPIQRTIEADEKRPAPLIPGVVQRDHEESEDSSPVTWRGIMEREVGIMHNQMFPWLEAEAQKDGMSTLVRGLTDLPFNKNQQDNDLFKRNALRALFIGWDRPFTLAGLKKCDHHGAVSSRCG